MHLNAGGCRRSAVPVWAVLALAGCGGDKLGATGVRLDLTTDDPALAPWRYEVLWLDDEGARRTFTVPDSGRLSDDPRAQASLFIEVDAATVGRRRVVARGVRDATVVSLGAATVVAQAGTWLTVSVVTSAPEKIANADGDDLPDAVDVCPTVRDPCPTGGDAAMDLAADASADAPPLRDGRPADGAPDSGG